MNNKTPAEVVRERAAAGCPLARELRVMRGMCSCFGDEDMVDEAQARYAEMVAALSAVEGEAVAWMVERDSDPSFPRLMRTEAEADSLISYCNVNPPVTKRPLIYGDTAPPPQQAVEVPLLSWWCPRCGGAEVSRERRPNGNATCENGHTYPARETVMAHERPTLATQPQQEE